MSNLTLQEIIKNLKHDDVQVRKDAINELVGIQDEIAIDSLIEATTDENAQVRFKAAEILGGMGEVAVDRLIDKFNSSSGKNKRFLTFALKETQSDKAIKCFREAASDEDFGTRKIAIRSLGELQAHDEIAIIEKGLKDDDWGVRLASVYALGDLASDESIAIIKKARREEKDKDFKKSCNKTLKKAEKNKKAKAEGKTISKTLPMSQIKDLEKSNLQKAIKEYEKFVSEGQVKDAPYKRLCILYRKNDDYENEVRVLEKAIEIFSKEKPEKVDYFTKRLSKLKN